MVARLLAMSTDTLIVIIAVIALAVLASLKEWNLE
jgi:hypothetical protein